MQEQREKLMKQSERFNFLGPCGTVFTASNTGSWRLERPKVDYASCIKCGTCQRYCPTDVITIDKEAEKCVSIDWNYCKGCGICANECPKHCISMISEREAE